MVYLVPEAVHNGTTYTYLGILHAFPVRTGHGPLNHAHSLVSRFVPRYLYHFSESQKP